MKVFVVNIVEVITLYVNPVFTQVTLDCFGIFVNIKSAHLARKPSIFQNTFTIHDFKLISFLGLSMKIFPLRDLLVSKCQNTKCILFGSHLHQNDARTT